MRRKFFYYGEHALFYNYDIIYDSRGICPAGFKIPSDTDFQTLLTNIGGVTNSAIKLRASYGWDINNGTDLYGFRALPTGFRFGDPPGSYFKPNKFNTIFATSTIATIAVIRSDINYMFFSSYNSGYRKGAHSIRCIKENNIPSIGSIIDESGNTYTEVIIGNQIWLTENLKTTKYNNGENIPIYPELPNEWANWAGGAICYYNGTRFY